jgi:hypothetical protein
VIVPSVEPPSLREEYSLTAEHWQAISAAIPSHVKAEANWAELEPIVRAELDEAIVLFRALSARRQRYPIVEERRHWRRIIGLTIKLEAEMWWVLGRKPVFDVDDPHWPNRVLHELIWVRERAEVHSAFNDTWTAFRGQKNPYREHLYHDVLRVWTRRLKGRLENYWVTKGEPRGPLVEFFVACVRPVLRDETPRRGGIVDVIERERKREQHLREELEAYEAKRKSSQS